MALTPWPLAALGLDSPAAKALTVVAIWLISWFML
jgi:hypothetical protein